ncbi:MAG: WD40/YVTN/BNR-like repeat-containing protein, partial [Microcystaceae cyanobacterium]
PDFASDKTLYASGPRGIHQTLDGGVTWQPITDGMPLMKSSNIKLAISPNYKADKTVLAGSNRGIFISKDKGASWLKLTSSADEENVQIEGIAISPNYKNDQTFIVSVKGKGLYKTTDEGKTFIKIGNDAIALARITDLPSASIPIQFSPSYATDKTLYGFGSAKKEIYKSTDSGNTWETITIPRNENNKYDFLTSINLVFFVYRKQFLRVGAAVLLALLSYFLLGFLGLEKRLPFSQLQIKFWGSLIVLVAALIILLA